MLPGGVAGTAVLVSRQGYFYGTPGERRSNCDVTQVFHDLLFKSHLPPGNLGKMCMGYRPDCPPWATVLRQYESAATKLTPAKS